MCLFFKIDSFHSVIYVSDSTSLDSLCVCSCVHVRVSACVCVCVLLSIIWMLYGSSWLTRSLEMIVNKAPINIPVEGFVWTQIFTSFRKIAITASHVIRVFTSARASEWLCCLRSSAKLEPLLLYPRWHLVLSVSLSFTKNISDFNSAHKT